MLTPRDSLPISLTLLDSGKLTVTIEARQADTVAAGHRGKNDAAGKRWGTHMNGTKHSPIPVQHLATSQASIKPPMMVIHPSQENANDSHARRNQSR